ncbi:unnamed protein product [Knipowitschia caucasica]
MRTNANSAAAAAAAEAAGATGATGLEAEKTHGKPTENTRRQSPGTPTPLPDPPPARSPPPARAERRMRQPWKLFVL